MSRTGDHNYFENFQPGEVYEHTRAKTVTEMDNVMLTNLVLNTSEGHFNEARMQDSEFGERITFGGITLSLVLGIASEDISENALRILGIDDVELTAPVVHGDTVSAESEVVSKRDSAESPRGGVVEFRVSGYNQDGDKVAGATQTVLVKKREYFLDG